MRAKHRCSGARSVGHTNRFGPRLRTLKVFDMTPGYQHDDKNKSATAKAENVRFLKDVDPRVRQLLEKTFDNVKPGTVRFTWRKQFDDSVACSGTCVVTSSGSAQGKQIEFRIILERSGGDAKVVKSGFGIDGQWFQADRAAKYFKSQR